MDALATYDEGHINDNPWGRFVIGEVLNGRFEALEAQGYDLPGVERHTGRDTRLNTAVVIDAVSSVAPTAVRRAALRAMSVRDPRLARIVAVTTGQNKAATIIVSEPLPGVTLDSVLHRRRLDEARAKAVVGEAARALAVASAVSVHHGWIRPACVSVDARGKVTVAGAGVDGELALQAGLRRGTGEQADATALSRLFLACVTGKDADAATAADIPATTSDDARALCERVIAGKGFGTLAELSDAIGSFDTRSLRSLPSRVDSLPLSVSSAVAAEKRRKRDRLEAARRAFTGPRVTGGVTIARETLVKAEAEASTGSIPLVAEPAGVEDSAPTTEELEDLHDILTFEAMVDEQVAGARPTVPELFYTRLHDRWPKSRYVTKRLERAHDRAINGGPIYATPIVLGLLVLGLVAIAIMAATLLSGGIGPIDPPGDGLDNYPSYTYGP